MTNPLSLAHEYLRSPRVKSRAAGTQSHYRAALAHFCDTGDADAPRVCFATSLPDYNGERINLLANFLIFLRERGLSALTARAYVVDVRTFLEWCALNDLLPRDWPMEKMSEAFDDVVSDAADYNPETSPPEIPEGIERLLTYHGDLTPPDDLKEDKLHIWELDRLRDAALIRALHDSGGRISEILSLRTGDFPPMALEQTAQGGYWRVLVTGKKNHKYHLWLRESVFFIDEYMEARGKTAEHNEPLFAWHKPDKAGEPFSRQMASWVTVRASRALGLGDITPHDFRHWKATRLRSAGLSLEDIAHVIGHMDIQTTKDYYAHVDVSDLEARLRRVEE